VLHTNDTAGPAAASMTARKVDYCASHGPRCTSRIRGGGFFFFLLLFFFFPGGGGGGGPFRLGRLDDETGATTGAGPVWRRYYGLGLRTTTCSAPLFTGRPAVKVCGLRLSGPQRARAR